MRRDVVEVIPVFLDVLAVVALPASQAEQALLEDRVIAVPQGNRETQPLAFVADAEQAIFVPAVGAAPRVLVREVAPHVAVGTVVLAHRAPRPFGEIRPPETPRRRARVR